MMRDIEIQLANMQNNFRELARVARNLQQENDRLRQMVDKSEIAVADAERDYESLKIELAAAICQLDKERGERKAEHEAFSFLIDALAAVDFQKDNVKIALNNFIIFLRGNEHE